MRSSHCARIHREKALPRRWRSRDIVPLMPKVRVGVGGPPAAGNADIILCSFGNWTDGAGRIWLRSLYAAHGEVSLIQAVVNATKLLLSPRRHGPQSLLRFRKRAYPRALRDTIKNKVDGFFNALERLSVRERNREVPKSGLCAGRFLKAQCRRFRGVPFVTRIVEA